LDWPAYFAIAVTLLLALFSALRSYGDDHTALTSRVLAIEQHNADSDRRMERIENKIDRLLERAGDRR
jgi:hypothetical protein